MHAPQAFVVAIDPPRRNSTWPSMARARLSASATMRQAALHRWWSAASGRAGLPLADFIMRGWANDGA